nr:FAD-binding protein [uncultured Desulfobacter sp.]
MDTTFLVSNGIAFEEDISLKTKTWIKRGGIAKVWVQPTTISDFKKVISWIQQKDFVYEVIGNTSNCYFLNNYNPDVIVSTLKVKEIKILEDEGKIVCDCGYNMSKLAKYCNANGIKGFEGFTGLPGTVAGAAINNSGCLDSLCSKIINSVRIVNNGEEIEVTNQELCYEHRGSKLKSKAITGVVTQVIFNIERDNPEILIKKAKQIELRRRKFLENKYPNLGSSYASLEFKRNIWEKVFYKIIKLSFLDPVLKRKISNKFFLKSYDTESFRNYVSELNFNCFTWKDDDADEAFFEYIDFVKNFSKAATLEIEIKGKK